MPMGFAKRMFRFITGPEEMLKRYIVRRFSTRETNDHFDLRRATLWGWCLDRFRRNLAVAIKIRDMAAGRKMTVLDVGAAESMVRDFLPLNQFQVYGVDLDGKRLASSDAEKFSVVADGCNLPFLDGAFDIVVSVDCLEHVPEDRRVRYLQELQRVARRGVILHFPAVGPPEFQGDEFESRFRDSYSLTFRRDQFIEEHLQNGLPVVGQVAAQFSNCSVVGRENGPLWVKYMFLERFPYLSFLTGLFLFPFRNRLDEGPYHAALLICDK